MRPGMTPIENLVEALRTKEALGSADVTQIRSTSFGLVKAVGDANLTTGESLLLVVDQFEEIFRFQRRMMAVDGGADADRLVRLLLSAVQRPDAPVYVVLTMRSDFLGDCAQFPGLPEALSESQYLIPRLTRDQRRQAIEEPLRLFGAEMTPQLVEQLLNDSAIETGDSTDSGHPGRAPDPLPVLQHALMRTYVYWKSLSPSHSGDRIDLNHYTASGRMESALDQHAEAIYRGVLDDEGRRWAERIFRCLTTMELGRPIRRPTPLAELYEVIGASDHERPSVDKVLDVFRRPDQSFLQISREQTADISHESLIWKWKRLAGWVKQEAVSAEMYRDLADDALGTTTWGEPKLSSTLALRNREEWNASWARQYSNADFSHVKAFLERSRRAVRNQRWLRWGAAAAALVVVVLAYWTFRNIQENASLKAAQESLTRAASEDQRRFAEQLASLDARAARVGTTQAERDQIATEKADLQDQLKKSQDENGKQLDQTTTLQGSVAALQSRLDTTQRDLAEESKKRQVAEAKVGDLEGRLAAVGTARGPQAAPAATEAPTKVASTGSSAPTEKFRADMGYLPNEPLLGFVPIKAGPFMMGSDKKIDPLAQAEESPQHSVNLDDFYVGRYEVTLAQYKACVSDGGCRAGDVRMIAGPEDWPVRYVSWHEAMAYCAWLERKLKTWAGVPNELRAGFSGSSEYGAWHITLPSEAEWEKAARGTRGGTYPWGNEIDPNKALYRRHDSPTPVGSFPQGASPYGVLDMIGNVEEWTRSLWGKDRAKPSYKYPYDPDDAKRENLKAPDDVLRTVRGGSFFNLTRDLRAARRDKDSILLYSGFRGFRVVLTRPLR